jgi:hypothetical protein
MPTKQLCNNKKPSFQRAGAEIDRMKGKKEQESNFRALRYEFLFF